MAVLNCAPLHAEFDALLMQLRLGNKILPPTFERTAHQMEPVLLDYKSGWSRRVLYTVWRNIARHEDVHKFGVAGLEYDITVLDNVFVKPERNKTFGHYHPPAEGGLEYPEVYEVLFGEAVFLLQRHAAPSSSEVIDVLAVEARAGEKVVIPPGYGHVSINAGSTALVLANMQAMHFSAEYELFARKRGAAYYCLEDGEFTPNKRYRRVPPLKRVKARDLKNASLLPKDNLYASFLGKPHLFAFLREPHRFHWQG